MTDGSVGFASRRVNPGFRDEDVTEWLQTGQVPTESAERPDLRAVPRARGTPTTLARLARPQASRPTRLAVVSDVHLSTTNEGSWKLFHRSETRLRQAVDDVGTRGVDGVVVAGDLTEDGHPEDVARAAELLSDLSVPVLPVPGNHDAPTDPGADASFSEGALGTLLPGGFPYRGRVGGVDVLCLDSTRAASGEKATLADDQLAWLAETVSACDDPIVVSHHNLPGLLSATGGDSWRSSFPLRNADRFGSVLRDSAVGLHVSGHLHIPALAATGGVRELIAPALCSFPGGYLLVDVGPEGTTVRYVPVVGLPGLTEGWEAARAYKPRSRMVARMALGQVTALPLVDERGTAT
ncbi:metallophosphoesterase family protein [Halomicroarcula sp. GCM10025817]|uniref:metallophosphoesterase family protein n=1 Tax=Haloarcula TaxID=2237 RepID=UPI0023E81B1B|nr:metallophosphoesterase [Halomicroarcula sp. SYNS111]